MSDIAIRVDNISKKYLIGNTSSGSLRETLVNAFSTGNKSKTEEFWALKDISFEVKRGEAIGIIGKNGAGKSTLLKVLSRITEPTKGRIEIEGRVSSLLEVGTGFHPELTGRENVFLNGTILGMKRQEIKDKFDEIVEFSGVAKFLDTPVKRYSSGMKVRLAFAVAAHLEPEILIIDEVLAVGDAEFQKKCLGKMKDVAGEGRTVLFVSHNMGAVKSLCTSAIMLKQGKIHHEGDVASVVTSYLGGEAQMSNKQEYGDKGQQIKEGVFLKRLQIHAKGKNIEAPMRYEDELEVETVIINHGCDKRLDATLQFKNEQGEIIFVSSSGIEFSDDIVINGEFSLKCTIPRCFLNSGNFFVNLLIVENKRNVIFKDSDALSFTMLEKEKKVGDWMGRTPGPLKPALNWEIIDMNAIANK